MADDLLTLGAPVRFTWTLHRRTVERDRLQPRSLPRKVWSTEGYPGQREPEPRDGVVVGVRTLANGDVQWGSYDEPTTFYPTEHFRAYLVAYDLRRKPVLVLPEHLEELRG